ncbi:hypothetical protein ABZ865_34305 [Streptomyces sp. NPDC047085]|uniref:hypothetical protein n=1 Tax=Streptomyces sp. NPDC047085 TaxID=3155140 RepID=UPI0033E6F1C3
MKETVMRKRLRTAILAAAAAGALLASPMASIASADTPPVLIDDSAALVAAQHEIIDQLNAIGWPDEDADNFYPGAAGHTDTTTGTVTFGTVGSPTSYQVEAKCAAFLTASLKHAYSWATDSYFTSTFGSTSPTAEKYYDTFLANPASLSPHFRPTGQGRVTDLAVGSIIAVRYNNGTEDGASGHVMVVSQAPRLVADSRNTDSGSSVYAVRVMDSTGNPHGVATTWNKSPHWAYKDSRVEGVQGGTSVKEWSGAGEGTVFIRANNSTGLPNGYWWGANEGVMNTSADRPMTFMDVTRAQ